MTVLVAPRVVKFAAAAVVPPIRGVGDARAVAISAATIVRGDTAPPDPFGASKKGIRRFAGSGNRQSAGAGHGRAGHGQPRRDGHADTGYAADTASSGYPSAAGSDHAITIHLGKQIYRACAIGDQDAACGGIRYAGAAVGR